MLHRRANQLSECAKFRVSCHHGSHGSRAITPLRFPGVRNFFSWVFRVYKGSSRTCFVVQFFFLGIFRGVTLKYISEE